MARELKRKLYADDMSFLSCLIWLGPKHRLCSRSFPANISWILNASEPYYHLRGWEVRYIRLLDLWPHSHSAIMLLSPPQPSGAKSPTGLGSSTLGLKSRQSPFANQEFSEEVRISERERQYTEGNLGLSLLMSLLRSFQSLTPLLWSSRHP